MTNQPTSQTSSERPDLKDDEPIPDASPRTFGVGAARDAAIVREVTALIDEAERGVREMFPRLYEQMEAEGGATSLTTRRLREAIARGVAAAGDVPAELLDGATERGPENAWPANPGEFAARWNALDDGARARWLGEAVEAMSSIDAIEVARLREAKQRLSERAAADILASEQREKRLRAALVKVRVAVELVVQDVRAQRGDHIAGLVEDSFAAHMALASVPAVDAGEVAGPCRSGCGPGYRYGDEGCRHTPAAVDAGDREPASEGDHRPCCCACDGTGFGPEGMCWDCRGTGCAHPPASEVRP